MILKALAFAAAVGTASAPPPAIDAYNACLQLQAAALDDHVSDAGTIARAVADVCQPQRERYFTETLPPDQASGALYGDGAAEAAERTALVYVLRAREARLKR